MNNIGWDANLYALLYVYWTKLLFYSVIAVCVYLFIHMALANLAYEQKNRELNDLMLVHSECRTKVQDLLHTVAGTRDNFFGKWMDRLRGKK